MTRPQPAGTPTTRIHTACRTIALLWATAEQPPRSVETTTRTAYGPRLPGSSEALAIRVTATRDLAVVAWHLRARLDLRTVLDGADVPALAGFIDTHADSLAILDDTAVHVLEQHARALGELIRQTRPSRIRVADCPRCDTGVLYAALRPEDPEQLGNVIACDNRDQVDVVEDGVHVRRPVCGASWTSFEWRACWREVIRVHGHGGRRGGRPTRWDGYDPAGVERLASALGVPRPSRGAKSPGRRAG